MKQNEKLIRELIIRSTEPAFGHHLMLMRDAGYTDEMGQLTEKGRRMADLLRDDKQVALHREAALQSGVPFLMVLNWLAEQTPTVTAPKYEYDECGIPISGQK